MLYREKGCSTHHIQLQGVNAQPSINPVALDAAMFDAN